MKTELTHGQKMLREMEWTHSPILNVSYHNPVVRSLMDAYNAGHIITKEERLSRMVVHLARDWIEMQEQAFEAAMRATPFLITNP